MSYIVAKPLQPVHRRRGRGVETVRPPQTCRQNQRSNSHARIRAIAAQIVKAVRRAATPRLRVERAGAHRVTRKEWGWEQSTNVYASNLALLACSPEGLEELGRRRWRIDTEVFKTLTTECQLKHPAVHQQHDHALVVLTMIRVLAYTLMLVFFHRQVLSHRRPRPPSLAQMAGHIVPEFARHRDDSS